MFASIPFVVIPLAIVSNWLNIARWFMKPDLNFYVRFIMVNIVLFIIVGYFIANYYIFKRVYENTRKELAPEIAKKEKAEALELFNKRQAVRHLKKAKKKVVKTKRRK